MKITEIIKLEEIPQELYFNENYLDDYMNKYILNRHSDIDDYDESIIDIYIRGLLKKIMVKDHEYKKYNPMTIQYGISGKNQKIIVLIDKYL